LGPILFILKQGRRYSRVPRLSETRYFDYHIPVT